jgi:hypothetical protein
LLSHRSVRPVGKARIESSAVQYASICASLCQGDNRRSQEVGTNRHSCETWPTSRDWDEGPLIPDCFSPVPGFAPISPARRLLVTVVRFLGQRPGSGGITWDQVGSRTRADYAGRGRTGDLFTGRYGRRAHGNRAAYPYECSSSIAKIYRAVRAQFSFH